MTIKLLTVPTTQATAISRARGVPLGASPGVRPPNNVKEHII